MKTGIEIVNSDPTKRRLDSTEAVTSLGTGLLLAVVGFFCPPLAVAVAVSVIADAYMVSRTLVKVSRDSMKYSGFMTTEIKALGIAQGSVLAAFACGASPVWSIGVLAVNQAVFNLCRGAVKKKEPTHKTTVYSV